MLKIIAEPIHLFAEMSQGGTTLKRKFEGDHDNENGVDSPNNLIINDSDVNGDQDDNDENTPPPLPSPEVSLLKMIS